MMRKFINTIKHSQSRFLKIILLLSTLIQISSASGAFVTIFYDNGPTNTERFLAIRVLMLSIAKSNTKHERWVLVPSSVGISSKRRKILESEGIHVQAVNSLVTIDPNVISGGWRNPLAHLVHWRNWLALWDDPVLKSKDRWVVIDPECTVVRNLDEIFHCTSLCLVDSGQPIVYANALMVVSPSNGAGRRILETALRDFEMNGKLTNYRGIDQGFIPKLFEAVEEAPYFNESTDEEDVERDSEDPQGVVKRLPFYYSLNHMVYYERLNWDLYQCNNPNRQELPGPLLSFKYSGHAIKPWHWYSYTYFNVCWEWLKFRELLNEDHLGFFFEHLVLALVVNAVVFTSFFLMGQFMVLKCALPRSLRSFLSQAIQHKEFRVLLAVLIVGTIHFCSVQFPPGILHPMYACKLWLLWQVQLMHGIVVIIRLLMIVQNHRTRLPIPQVLSLVIEAIKSVLWPSCAFLVLFLLSTNERYYSNPVQKPIVVAVVYLSAFVLQARLVAHELFRYAVAINSPPASGFIEK